MHLTDEQPTTTLTSDVTQVWRAWTGAIQSYPSQSIMASNSVIFALLVVLSILIMVMNGMVLFVIASVRNLQNATGYLMGCLSVADFGVGLSMVIPLAYAPFTSEFPATMCDTIAFINSTAWVVSVYTLMLLSVDRYVSIISPLTYHTQITNRRTMIAIALTWLFGAALWMLPLVGVGKYKFNDEEITCYFDVHGHPMQWIIYMVIIFIPTSGVVIFCYAAIWQTTKTLPPHPTPDGPSREKVKAVRTLVIIVGGFYLAWLPFIAEHLAIAVVDDSVKVPEWLELICYILAVANSFWNPIIYVGTNKNFREATRRVVFKERTFCKSRVVAPATISE